MKKLSAFICIVLILLFIRFYFFFEKSTRESTGGSFDRQVTLLLDPKIQGRLQTFKTGSVQIQTVRSPQYHYGQTLHIVGILERKQFTAKNGKAVAMAVVSFPRITVIQNNNMLLGTASFLRQRVFDAFFASLPKNEAALLFGIVFGGSSSFDSNIYEAFRNTGVLHVVAASGMNVTMVSGFLIAFLGRFLRRQLALCFGLMGIFYYALISGFQPSILRATIMAGIAFSAGILGRQNIGFFSLFLTAAAMLFINPETLFDAGFLLSFTSTAGILFIKPLFDRISFIRKTKAVSDDITTTVSAQLGSIPIMASFFSAYSIISVAVNALVLWTIPVLMILGGAAAFCAIVLPFISFIILLITYPLLLYFEKVVLLFGTIPMLELGSFPPGIVIGYYIVLVSLIYIFKKKIRSSPVSTLGDKTN